MDTEGRISRLLLRWQQLREAGRTLSVEELCADCPEACDAVRRELAALGPTASFLSAADRMTLPPSAAPAAPEPQAPQQAGRFQILGEIARGGMGVVLMARDPELGRELAVKVMLPVYQDAPTVCGRFLAEAQLAGQLQHPGVATGLRPRPARRRPTLLRHEADPRPHPRRPAARTARPTARVAPLRALLRGDLPDGGLRGTARE